MSVLYWRYQQCRSDPQGLQDFQISLSVCARHRMSASHFTAYKKPQNCDMARLGQKNALYFV